MGGHMGALYICRWAHLWADISHLVKRQPAMEHAAYHDRKQVVSVDKVPELFPFFQIVTLQIMDNTKVVAEVVSHPIVFVISPAKTPRVFAYFDWDNANGAREDRLGNTVPGQELIADSYLLEEMGTV